jgi:hypothetical protein
MVVPHNVVYAEGDSLVVVYSDILRGARSNVNRELLSVNIEDDGVIVGGVTEAPAKAVLKAGIKKGTAFGESFSVTSERIPLIPPRLIRS